MRAESLAIAGNRILAVGSNADMKALKGSHTRVIDAQMNTVMPGIVESHIHLFGGAVELDSLMINNIKGFPAVSAAIREYASGQPEGADHHRQWRGARVAGRHHGHHPPGSGHHHRRQAPGAHLL